MSANAILLVPLLAAATAYASPDSDRPAAIAHTQAVAKRAIRLAIEASAQRRGELHLVEVIDGTAYLATRGPVPDHDDLVPNEARDVWTGTSAAQSSDGVEVGDGFVVVSPNGATFSCQVDAIDVLVRGATMEGFDSGTDTPSCGQAETWARLTCGEGVTDGFAVPIGTPVAIAYPPADAVSDVAAENATSAVLRSRAWHGLLREAEARAGGTSVSDDLQIRAFDGPDGPVYSVEAVVYSDDGYAVCGGEDYLARVIGVVDAHGRELVPFFRFEGPVSEQPSTVSGLIDTDRDGIPEIWTTPYAFDGRQALLDERGGERLAVDHPWCGCPC
jgi:hypothetical protein